jgi:putrescine aminotransferase
MPLWLSEVISCNCEVTTVAEIDKLHFNINKKGLTDAQKLEITEQTMQWLHDHVNPALTKWRKSGDTRNIEWDGRNIHLKDIMGNDFIDCLGGYGVFNLGHMHPKIVRAAKTQLDYMGISSQELLNPDQARLAKLLADVAPGDLQYTFFSNSGTESVEAAIKLAFLYTGKHEIISAEMAYHGKTLGALSATQRDVFRKPYEPLVPGFSAVPWNDAAALGAAITDKTAAVILEPVQGEAGIRVPDDDYLPAVRRITKDRGVLLIFDEVQSGMGRTGKFLACENWDVVPDIVCLAKALGGGLIPIGATMSTAEIWQCLEPNPFIHSNTFGGNPLVCVVAIAAIEVLLKENLMDNAARMGKYFLKGLKALAAKYAHLIKEVRGLGLMIGIEMKEREPAVNAAKGLFNNRVLVAHTMNNPNVIRIEPPLMIGQSDIDEVLRRLDEVLKAL